MYYFHRQEIAGYLSRYKYCDLYLLQWISDRDTADQRLSFVYNAYYYFLSIEIFKTFFYFG